MAARNFKSLASCSNALMRWYFLTVGFMVWIFYYYIDHSFPKYFSPASNNNLSDLQNLNDVQLWAIETQRLMLRKEINDFLVKPNGQFPDDLIPEKGGKQLQILIFTTWRSGSSFLGELLSSHPGTFYTYEPLNNYEGGRISDPSDSEYGADFLQNLLNCDYSDEAVYAKYILNHEHKSWNIRLWQTFCEDHSDGLSWSISPLINLLNTEKSCDNPSFLTRMCKLFPFHAMKIIKLRLKYARSLLSDNSLNLKVIYLIRDPRATMQSRFSPAVQEWCEWTEGCNSPESLCTELVEDFKEVDDLQKEFPDKFMAIRYEDFASDIYNAVPKLFKDLGLKYTEQTKQFLLDHTTQTSNETFTTYRVTKSTPFKWINSLSSNFSLLESIQKPCDEALHLWGYNMITSENETESNFQPLLPPPVFVAKF